MPEQIKTSETIALVPARQIYPTKADTYELFTNAIETGDIELVEDSEHPHTIPITGWLDPKSYPDIDLSGINESGYHEYDLQQVHDSIPQEQIALFDRLTETKLRESIFGVEYLQKDAWWLVLGDNDPNNWLDTVDLHNVAAVEVAGRRFFVNDFSGKVDFPEFLEGLEHIARDLATQGLNVARFSKVINILPESASVFELSERLKAKNPDASIAATANKVKGVLNYNEKAIRPLSKPPIG